jgi:hypothetical protein
LTGHPCADNFKVRVEGDEVCSISGGDHSKLGLKAQKYSGRPRRHDESICKGDFEKRDGVPHSLDHGEESASECAVGSGQAIFKQRYLPSMQHELPLVCANQWHGIGDQHQSIASLAAESNA